MSTNATMSLRGFLIGVELQILINHANIEGVNKRWSVFKARALIPSLLFVQIQQPFGVARICIIEIVLNQGTAMLLL